MSAAEEVIELYDEIEVLRDKVDKLSEKINEDMDLMWEFATWLAGDEDVGSAYEEFLNERE